MDLHYLVVAAQNGGRTGWEGWPFGGAMAGTLWASAARIAFVMLLFGAIVWFLRWLYGPKGRLRPKAFGTGHIEERKRKKAQIEALRQRYKAGDISLEEYTEAQKKIWEDKPDAS